MAAAVAATSSSAAARRGAAASLRVVSWNVDGLDDDNDPCARAREVCAQLVAAPRGAAAATGLPDVIMLQEIVESTMNIFRCEPVPAPRHTFRCPDPALTELRVITAARLGRSGYDCVSDMPGGAPTGMAHYFTSIWTRRSTLKLIDATRTPFANSHMGRDLLEARCRLRYVHHSRCFLKQYKGDFIESSAAIGLIGDTASMTSWK